MRKFTLKIEAAVPHDTLTIAYQTIKYHSLDRSVDFHPCDNHKSHAIKFEFIYISGERSWHRLPFKCFCIASLQYFLWGTLLVAQLVEALRYRLEGHGFDS